MPSGEQLRQKAQDSRLVMGTDPVSRDGDRPRVTCAGYHGPKYDKPLGKGFIGRLDGNAGDVEAQQLGSMHVVENQPVGPVRACPPSVGYAVGATSVGILFRAIKDDPVCVGVR